MVMTIHITFEAAMTYLTSKLLDAGFTMFGELFLSLN